MSITGYVISYGRYEVGEWYPPDHIVRPVSTIYGAALRPLLRNGNEIFSHVKVCYEDILHWSLLGCHAKHVFIKWNKHCSEVSIYDYISIVECGRLVPLNDTYIRDLMTGNICNKSIVHFLNGRGVSCYKIVSMYAFTKHDGIIGKLWWTYNAKKI